MKKELKIISLGGSGDVNKNMYVYETKQDILVVDCGIGFPEMEMLGVDVLIPDVSYLKRKEGKLRGFIITQGHEDHFGALPYIIPQLKGRFPIYATKLVRGFIARKLKEFRLLDKVDLRLINPQGDSIKLRGFKIDAFRVNHSVPDTVGFVIQTPAGKIVHVSDFKFDWTPLDNKPFDVKKLCKLINDDDVNILLSDCLGSHSEGYTKSEKDIEKSFDDLLSEAAHQVFVTTISSNISRIQQIINSSIKHSRKIVFLGKSISSNVEIACKLGYLDIPKDSTLSVERSTGYSPDKITFIVAGSYGQKNSALSRIAEGNFKRVKIKKEAMVIFSADPAPPGVKDSVDAVVNKLTNLGADVHHYEIQENLHVSGHGLQQDLLMLARIINPKYLIPIGGTSSMMHGYTKLMNKAGFKEGQVFEWSEGESVRLKNGILSLGETIKTVNVYVDGLGVGDVGTVVLKDRKVLSEGGILIIILPISGKDYKLCGNIDVASRGFVFEKESEWLLGKTKKIALDVVQKRFAQKDLPKVKKEIEERVSKYVFKETERRPLVLPIISLL